MRHEVPDAVCDAIRQTVEQGVAGEDAETAIWLLKERLYEERIKSYQLERETTELESLLARYVAHVEYAEGSNCLSVPFLNPDLTDEDIARVREISGR